MYDCAATQIGFTNIYSIYSLSLLLFHKDVFNKIRNLKSDNIFCTTSECEFVMQVTYPNAQIDNPLWLKNLGGHVVDENVNINVFNFAIYVWVKLNVPKRFIFSVRKSNPRSLVTFWANSRASLSHARIVITCT